MLDLLPVDTTLLTFDTEPGRSRDRRWHVYDFDDHHDRPVALCGKTGIGRWAATVGDRESAMREHRSETILCQKCMTVALTGEAVR